MVSRNYLLDKPPQSGPLYRKLVQDAYPVLINGAGAAERAAWVLRERTQRHPVSTLLFAAVVGSMLSAVRVGRRRGRRGVWFTGVGRLGRSWCRWPRTRCP